MHPPGATITIRAGHSPENKLLHIVIAKSASKAGPEIPIMTWRVQQVFALILGAMRRNRIKNMIDSNFFLISLSSSF